MSNSAKLSYISRKHSAKQGAIDAQLDEVLGFAPKSKRRKPLKSMSLGEMKRWLRRKSAS